MEIHITKDDVMELFKALSIKERVELFDRITMVYCQHCGWESPLGEYCQCTNDE